MSLKPVYIHVAKRTPTGGFLGKLSKASAPTLASYVIKDLLATIKNKNEKLFPEQVILGQVLQAGVGQAPARQAALMAKMPDNTPCLTLNRVCGSGLEAVIQGAKIIALGDATSVIAGGMESMSNAPFGLLGSRQGHKYGNQELVDLLMKDGLTDAYNKESMGLCVEKCLTQNPLSRKEQDEFAINSFEKALNAQKNNFFKNELTVLAKDSFFSEDITQDEGPEKFNPSKMLALKPAFLPTGTITAANASSLSDGASALLLSSIKEGASFEIVSYAHHAQKPEEFALAPISAAKKALERAKLKVEQIDLFEINEAFAAVALYFMDALKLKPEQVNIFGGAIALGHPLGSSGSRILVTLLNAMTQKNSHYGMCCLCIGGGEGIALIVKKC